MQIDVPHNSGMDCNYSHVICNPDAIQFIASAVDGNERLKQGEFRTRAPKENNDMNFKKSILASTAFAVLALSSLHVSAQDMKDPKVGGAEMYPSKTIVENAINSPIHKTLVAAVKAAGLVDTLSSAGPFTVFAPTDAAFAKLPAGTVDTLVKPENKDKLTAILTYHVVAGKYSTSDIDKMIKTGGGKATMKTVQGEDLTFSGGGKHITITDSKGGTAMITIANVYQSNGVIQVIDSVLMP